LARQKPGCEIRTVSFARNFGTSKNPCSFLKAWRLALPGLFLRVLFFAENDLALPHQLIVEPEAILVGSAFEADAGRAAQQAHACRGLKDIGRKGAAVYVEFDAKIASVGDPRDLISGVENDYLRYQSNEYGTLCHFSSAPCFRARC
jgi:hypothetical protein